MNWHEFFMELGRASGWVKLLVMGIFLFICFTAIQWVLLPWRLKGISESLKRIVDNTGKDEG